MSKSIKKGKKGYVSAVKNTSQKINSVSTQNWNHENYQETLRNFIKENMKDQPYEFYDEYVSDDKKEYFQKPIGLYDPLGENINPYTMKPYENFYDDLSAKTYTFGPLEDKKYLPRYELLSYIVTDQIIYKKYLNELIKTIRENQVTLLVAGTGVGKTVITPPAAVAAFNYQKKVICTIPKTGICRSAAEFAAQLSGVQIGKEIGYFYSGKRMADENTLLTFCTTGSLISIITGNDPYLENYDCIIIDEAHERSVETDLLLFYVKKALIHRRDLKLIIMSATINKDLFLNYFPNGTVSENNKNTNNISKAKFKTQEIDVGGQKNFDVEVFYESKPIPEMDWKIKTAEKTVELLTTTTEGDIIIFVASSSDGNFICNDVRSKLRGRNDITPFCVNFHAGTSDDDKAYAKGNKNYHDHPNADPSKPYTRKLIFATNAVESSLTIATIVYVIDSGYCYEESYSPKDDVHSLMLERISQASSNQRKGRAGRTQNGYCYRMYTEEEFNGFKEYNIPDIQKTDLTSKILDMMRLPYIKDVNDTHEKIFKHLIEPPFEEFVQSAIHKLYGLGCIDKEDKTGQITEIGKALAQFRKIELHLAKAILLSYYLQCKFDVIEIILIYNDISGKINDIFDEPRIKKGMNESVVNEMKKDFEKKKRRFYSEYGDYMTIYNIYRQYKYFLKPKNGTVRTKDEINMWFKENYIRRKVFTNKNDDDKVHKEAYQIQRKLMDIVQPPELKKKYFNELKKLQPNLMINKINEEIKNKKENEMRLDFETSMIETNKNKNKNKMNMNMKINEMIMMGGMLNKNEMKKYTLNLFPGLTVFEDREDNMTMALAMGSITNFAKLINQNRGVYKSCYPLEKVKCKFDRDTSLIQKVHPVLVYYGEIFRLRKDQDTLKLNFVNRIPTKVLDKIQEFYPEFIKEYLKKEKNNSSNQKKHYGRRNHHQRRRSSSSSSRSSYRQRHRRY